MSRWGAAVFASALLLGQAAPGVASPENAILPVEQYSTAKAKNLAVRYKTQLVQFSDHVYHCLPWLDVRRNGEGIGFRRQPKSTESDESAEADERYLQVWITIEQSDDEQFGKLSQARRVSAMFSRYGVDMLRRMTQLAGIASDADVFGFSVVLSWLKPGSMGRDKTPTKETLALFVDKASLGEFLARRLAASEFVNRAKFHVFQGNERVGRLPLDDVWEDNFNSTFKLKNYELAKGKKC